MLVDLDDIVVPDPSRITPEADFKMVTTDKQGQALAYEPDTTAFCTVDFA